MAVTRILDGAGAAFADLGVEATTTVDIARYAGCSRGTVYRYFATRRDLDRAYVNREALRLAPKIAAQVRAIADPRRRLVEAVLAAVGTVRADPRLAVWFTPADAGSTAGLTRDSEVLDGIAGAFVGALAGPATPEMQDGSGLRDTARWVVRIIVSLLSMPGRDEDDERSIVETFVVPSVFATGGHGPAAAIRPGAKRR